jgi:hypothetical protein
MRITTLGTALVVIGLATGGALAQSAGQGGQQGAFCLQSTTGSKNCSFATMDACNKAKTGQSDSCAANAARTTGAAPAAPGARAPAAAGPTPAAEGGRPSTDARPAGSNPPGGGGSPANK